MKKINCTNKLNKTKKTAVELSVQKRTLLYKIEDNLRLIRWRKNAARIPHSHIHAF